MLGDCGAQWKLIFKQKYQKLQYASSETPGRDDLSFEVPVDATVVMLGATGTGKSCLMNFLISETFINTEISTGFVFNIYTLNYNIFMFFF